MVASRDLIIYILENHLMYTSIASVEEVAVKLKCGPASVKALIELGKLEAIKIGNDYLVFIEERMNNDDR